MSYVLTYSLAAKSILHVSDAFAVIPLKYQLTTNKPPQRGKIVPGLSCPYRAANCIAHL